MAITASQYNSIRDKVVLVMGTGATGYGQTLTSTSATSTNIISSTLWNGLRTDMLKARQHQTGVDESANLPILTRNTVISDAIRIQFDKTMFNGTGNFLVDKILEKYVKTIVKPGII